MNENTAPVVGLIVPPAHGEVPQDAHLLYGKRETNGHSNNADRVSFIARGLGIGAVSPTGFNPVVDHIVGKACELRDAGAIAISLMGTSISFYRGHAFTQDLRAAMQQATGLPCTTMSHAIVAALKALKIQRVAVATSYIDELNDRLVDYLSFAGFEVTAIHGLNLSGVQEIGEVSPQTLLSLADSAYQQDPTADGIFISCGGLLTHPVIEPLEAKYGLPATASSPAGFWDVMRVAGQDASAEGFGRLFRTASMA